MTDVVEPEKKGWLSRLRDGLSKSTKRVTESITGLFTKKKLDQKTLDDLEDALIQADLGVSVAARLIGKLGKERFGKEVTDEEVRAAFADDIAEILQPVATPLVIDVARKPHVVLVVGVNGSGKTTTIAKLANLYKREGRKVMLAAGDTFRAAAVEQLEIWAKRADVDIVRAKDGSDPAAVVFDAIQSGKAKGRNPILVDTAGRLHNRLNLMNELDKIRRVAARAAEGAPHEVLLVLDATVGQNGVQQAREFTSVAGVTGIVLTKLDGTAKGGVAVAIAHELKLPIRYVGVGEGIDDLIPFSSRDYVDALFQDKW